MVASSLMLVLGAFAPVHSQELFLDNKVSETAGWYVKNSNGKYGLDSHWNGDDHVAACDCGDEHHVCKDGKADVKNSCSSTSSCNAICNSVSDCQSYYLFPPGSGLKSADGGGCYFKTSALKASTEEELTLDNKVSHNEGWYVKNSNGNYYPDSEWNGDDHVAACDCGEEHHVCKEGKADVKNSCSSTSSCDAICNSVSDCQSYYLFPPGSGLKSADGGGCYFKTSALKASTEEELALDNTASEVMGCSFYDQYGNTWTVDDLDKHAGRCDCGEPGHTCSSSGGSCSGDSPPAHASTCSDICRSLDGCVGFAFCPGSGCYFKA